MRVLTTNRLVEVTPGATAEIVVQVVNTGTIIDGVSARLIGVDDATVRVEPAMLPLFPDASGELVLTVEVGDTFLAGVHPLVVEVVSHTTQDVAHADVDLVVAARPSVRLGSTPRMVRARRSGRFVLDVRNQGNVPLEVELAAPATEAGVSVRLSPVALRVEPGTSAPVMAVVRGPRMVTGSEVDRTVTVELVGRRAENGRDASEAPADQADATTVQLRQRPLVSRGIITAAILVGIVGVWAAIFVFGLDGIFKNDPLAKTAPVSYYVGMDGHVAAATAEGAPAGFLQKTGLVPTDVGGSISGTVLATSDRRPVGGLLVKAFREGASRPVGMAATQTDGSYELAGLFPTTYTLQFTGPGYRPVWLSAASSGAEPADDQSGSTPTEVTVSPRLPVSVDDVLIVGKPGTLTGRVNVGDVDTEPVTQVSILRLGNFGDAAPLDAVSTIETVDGAYTFTDLPTPGTYRLTFTTPDYGNVSVVEELEGGESRTRPDVLVGAAGGSIAGVVSDENGPLGGVTVTTAVAGSTVTVQTPTVSPIGAYVIDSLPTPGTYILTFSAPGHGTRSETVELGAGENATTQNFTLLTGTTSIAGRVVLDATGTSGLGGVRVTLGGVVGPDGVSPTTTTITEGTDQGAFSFNNVAPGDYTLTFEHPSYATQTQPVHLTDTQPLNDLSYRLRSGTGTIDGRVLGVNGALLSGATITATAGATRFSAVNGDPGAAPLPEGGYLLGGLEPGWYSVTAEYDDLTPRTGLVHVVAGRTVSLDLTLRKEG